VIQVAALFSLALLLLAVPIFLVFGIGSVIVAGDVLNLPWTQFLQTSVGAVSKYVLLAIPLFVFAGYVMVAGGMARRLVDLCVALVGHWPGGLGISMVLAMAFFAAFCGSILAAITAIGTILMPRMVKAGFSPPFVAVLAATAALLEGVIPPSNAAIIYSSITTVPVAKTFAAGIVPGILLALMLSAYVAFHGRKLPRAPKAGASQRLRAFVAALPALVAPVIILGGIYGGWLTASEAAAVAGLWATAVGFLVYRELTVRSFVEALIATAIATAAIFVIIAMATFLSVVLIYTQVPQLVVGSLVALGTTPLVFLLMVALACLLLGTFVEVVPIFYIVLPVTLGMLGVLGVDPVHYYIVLTAFIGMGMLTPPVCIGVYTSSAVIRLSPEQAFRALPPFLLLGICYGLLMILFPALATWLPGKL
jgi:C4-dicarboxylate transporter DctM subunit